MLVNATIHHLVDDQNVTGMHVFFPPEQERELLLSHFGGNSRNAVKAKRMVASSA